MKLSNKIANAAGASKFVDFASSKIAKARTKDKAVKKLVTDKTSAKEAFKSAGMAASLAVPGLGVAKLARAMKAANKASRTMKPIATFKLPGSKVTTKVYKGGANPTSLRHLKGDSKQKFDAMRRAVRGQTY